jgi:hypothetical protein
LLNNHKIRIDPINPEPILAGKSLAVPSGFLSSAGYF